MPLNGDDYVDGGGSRGIGDFVNYGGFPHPVRIDLRAQTATGGGDVGTDVLIDIELARGTHYRDVILGDASSNRLVGGKGGDVIKARGGPDEIVGGGGDDRLFGGSGHDEVTGDGGDDNVYGGRGNDYLNGERGADELFGGPGTDTCLSGKFDSCEKTYAGGLKAAEAAVTGGEVS